MIKLAFDCERHNPPSSVLAAGIRRSSTSGKAHAVKLLLAYLAVKSKKSPRLFVQMTLRPCQFVARVTIRIFASAYKVSYSDTGASQQHLGLSARDCPELRSWDG